MHSSVSKHSPQKNAQTGNVELFVESEEVLANFQQTIHGDGV